MNIGSITVKSEVSTHPDDDFAAEVVSKKGNPLNYLNITAR